MFNLDVVRVWEKEEEHHKEEVRRRTRCSWEEEDSRKEKRRDKKFQDKLLFFPCFCLPEQSSFLHTLSFTDSLFADMVTFCSSLVLELPSCFRYKVQERGLTVETKGETREETVVETVSKEPLCERSKLKRYKKTSVAWLPSLFYFSRWCQDWNFISDDVLHVLLMT